MDLPQIGKGTYSKVYSSNEEAIKSIKHSNFESGVREIAMILACDHPNIIKIEKIGFGDRVTNISMKKYTGDLRSFLKLVNPLPIQMIYKFARDLLSGTAYIHARGIIHCDLKPENLLRDVGDNSLVICDFGIATLSSEKYHTTRVQTVTYRAPEVRHDVDRGQYSSYVDMWSVGCILCEMVTGESLIPTASVDEDSSINACKLFGIYSDGTRKQRLKLLRDLTKKYVFEKISEKLSKDHDRYQSLLASGFIHLTAQCLHPNHVKRIDASSAYTLVEKCREFDGRLILPARIAPPPFVTSDEMLCTKCVSSEILELCCTDRLLLAERIYRSYIAVDNDERNEINHACIFIASCLYANFDAVEAIMEKKINRPTILAAAASILLRLSGRILL